MAFGWTVRVEGFTWASLRSGDVLVSKDMTCALLILHRKGVDHVGFDLLRVKMQGVRGDATHINAAMWEVFRAERQPSGSSESE